MITLERAIELTGSSEPVTWYDDQLDDYAQINIHEVDVSTRTAIISYDTDADDLRHSNTFEVPLESLHEGTVEELENRMDWEDEDFYDEDDDEEWEDEDFYDDDEYEYD